MIDEEEIIMVKKKDEQKRVLPNDKKTLMDSPGYEVYNRDLLRKVFPRIISEAYDVVYAI
jgi:hypothetical protein